MVEALHGADLIDLPTATEGRAGHRHVRKAIEYMRASYADIVTIADVARVCGISVRNLEQSFRACWDMRPLEALNQIRLEEARRRLSSEEGTRSVTETALACGFTHLGRFAGVYKAKFGETPSQTSMRG